jgi:two-component system nitrogen regulation sensor histidine kinase NtrY
MLLKIDLQLLCDLQNFDDRFLYVVKYLDKNISKYLTESQEAINFYYNVEEKSTGIKFHLQ